MKKLDLIAYNNKKLIIDTWNNTENVIENPRRKMTFEEDLKNTTFEELLAERKRRQNGEKPTVNLSDSDT
jgi:hypothetical protein